MPPARGTEDGGRRDDRCIRWSRGRDAHQLVDRVDVCPLERRVEDELLDLLHLVAEAASSRTLAKS
jgi:hypothetical protein